VPGVTVSKPVPGARTREVEVKYWVGDLDVVIGALARRRVALGEPIHQDDQAYAPSGWSFGDPKLGVTFGRLRTQAGRHVFTAKTPVTNELDCAEYECEVSDRDQMHGALVAMGWRPTVRIVKRRRVGSAGDLTVCVDEVDGLRGDFLECELIVDDGEGDLGIQDELHAWVAELGVPARRVEQTYDSLLRDAALADS
jgi:adenylate cyclase class 2